MSSLQSVHKDVPRTEPFDVVEIYKQLLKKRGISDEPVFNRTDIEKREPDPVVRISHVCRYIEYISENLNGYWYYSEAESEGVVIDCIVYDTYHEPEYTTLRECGGYLLIREENKYWILLDEDGGIECNLSSDYDKIPEILSQLQEIRASE